MPKTRTTHPVVEKVRAELVRNKGEWLRLSRLEKQRHGAKMRFSYPWLHAFANNAMKSPGVVPVLALSEYLGMEISIKPGRHFAKFEP